MVQTLKAGGKGLMPLDTWKESPEFNACTAKMKLWLLTLIESGGDYTAATIKAYECKSPRQAQVFSYSVRNWARIKDSLNLYLGKTPLDVLLEDVIANLRRAEPGSVSAQRLLAQRERLVRLALGLTPSKEADEDAAESEISRPSPDVRVPAGATPLADDAGVIRGYRLPSGDYVRLIDGAVEVDVR
jgi:hypothetical protein